MENQLHENKTFKNFILPEKETSNVEFSKCVFLNCDFSNAIFTSCKFIDCVFTSCNLSMAKLKHCQLNDANFKDCKLLGINFSTCIDFLFVVKFEDCILDYSSFLKKKMIKTTFKNSSLKSVDFSECDLTKSVFANTNLLNAVFNRTNLKEVDFLTAINFTIDPEINTMKKAKFSLHAVSGLLNKYDIQIE